MPGDTRTAYLFQCHGEELFAVSPEKGRANIPRSSCTQGWLLRRNCSPHLTCAGHALIGSAGGR